MGIQCRIIRNKQGNVSYVEAPNGNRSKLYDDAVARVGEDSALDIVLTAYTPSFTEEVKNPKIDAFRRQLVDRINSIPSTEGIVTLNLEGIDYGVDPSTLEMTTEDLGNGETLINFTAEMELRYSMDGYVPVAPNGELSNLNQRQWKQVRTPEFMEWSNNWKDVVKDENGEPQIHYHGTPNHGFTEFNSEQGVNFFTPRREVADTYAGFERDNPESVYEVFIKSPKTLDTTQEIPNEVETFIEDNAVAIVDYLDENGLDDMGYAYRRGSSRRAWDDMSYTDKLLHMVRTEESNWTILEYPPLVEFLKKEGFTGIRTLEQKGNIGLFDSTAIKSATDNVGTFDNTNPDIRYQQGNMTKAPVEVLRELLNKARGTGLANEVYFLPESEIKEILEGGGVQFRQGINGFAWNDSVYINRDNAGLDTPIHEFGHLWNAWMKTNAPDVFNKGIELAKSQGDAYIKDIKREQPELEGDALAEEILAQAIGDNGKKFIDAAQKKSFKDWLSKLWKDLSKAIGLAETTVEDFEKLTLNDFASRAAVDILSGTSIQELMDTETGRVGAAFTIKPESNLTPTKPVAAFDYDADFISPMDRRSLKDVIEEYEGRVFIVTSDATGVGYDSNGDPIYGGVGYTAIKQNVDGNIGFASLDPTVAMMTMGKLQNQFGANQKVAVLVMAQNPSATVGNYYGAKYFARGLQQIKREDPELFEQSVESFIAHINTATVDKEFKKKGQEIVGQNVEGELNTKQNKEAKNVGEKIKQDLIDLIRNVDNYTPSEFSKEFIKDTTFNARTSILKSLIIPTATTNTVAKTPVIKTALRDRGFNRMAFLNEYGDNTIFTQEMYEKDMGGFVVSGFEYQTPENEEGMRALSEATQKRGLTHPQFNGKLPSTGKSWFFDGLYHANDNFSAFAKPQTEINYDYISEADVAKATQRLFPKDISYEAEFTKKGSKFVPMAERTYKHLKSPNKIAFKDILSEMDSQNLAFRDADVAVEVARGMGFQINPDGGLVGLQRAAQEGAFTQFDMVGFENNYNLEQTVHSVAVTKKSDSKVETLNIDGSAFEGEAIGAPVTSMEVASTVKELTPKAVANFVAENNEGIENPVIKLTKVPNEKKVIVSLHSASPEAQTDLYLDRINSVYSENPDQYWSVDIPSREQVLDAAQNGRLVDVNGGMGIVTEDGNMVGLFKYDDSARGTAASVQRARIDKGGIKLDNFDGYLTRLYEKNGFKVVSRLPFNEEFAPEGWNKEKHGTPDVVFMVYDPKGELGIEERTFDASDYDGALAYRDQFVEEAMDIHPFYREGLSINKTGETQNFFSDVVTGKSDKFKAKKAWQPLLPFSAKELNFKSTFDKFKGNFDNHIATSIPTFRETQIKVGNAIVEMFKGKDSLVYDIGGSEGGFAKAITEESDGKIKSINLDLNSDMMEAHNRTPVEGSEFVLEAFYEGYTDDDTGVTYKRHKPTQKADVVHESMVFQFIAPEREGFIKEVKKNYLKEDGIALFEEKLSTYQEAVWLANENKKNEYKSIYYSQEAITQKSEEVLTGMKKNQTYREEFQKILKSEFKFVEEYWDSGNFKGYLATDSSARRDEFLARIGGRITSEYSESQTKPKFSVGFVQTKSRPEGEQVILSNVDNRVQGQGLGTEMYKRVASNLAGQGTPLISDFNNKGAEGIWGKLYQAEIAEPVSIDGKVVDKVKMTPESFDTNGEPNVADVIQYIQSKNFEGEALSEVEANEVSNVLLGTELESSEELYNALRRGFTPNGVYNPSEDSLMATGLYSRVEARRLLDSEEAQLGAYEMMHKIKNSDTIPNVTEVDESYITITSQYNSLGTLKKANPFINQKTARELLGGIKDETLFSNQAEANDLDFANKKFNELSALTKVDRVKVEEGRTSPHTNIDEIRTRLEETLTLPTDAKLTNNLNYILSVPNDVWNLEFGNIRTILNEIEGNAVDIGLDLSNLNEASYDKTPSEVKDLLSAVRNFAMLQNESTFELLLSEYVTFFDISERNNTATLELSEETANKSLVYLETNENSYNLFDKHGLLPLGNNLYQKVNTNKSLDEVYDIVYQTIRSGRNILPSGAFKNEYDITNPTNEEFVREDIRNYANEASKDIENSRDYDSDILRKMVLFSAYFNTRLDNNRSVPSTTNEVNIITNYPKNAEYLRTEFIADFNKKMLKEKVKNSEKYNNFYRHFDITPQGIELVNSDPITMREIQPYLNSDLINHFRLKKEGIELDAVNDTVNDTPIEATNEVVMRNYYSNFPQALPLFKETYQMDNGVLVTNVSSEFIRVDEGVFEYVETVGDRSLYAKLNINNTDFKVYSTDYRTPNIGDISKFNTSQGIKADKKINNLYTKKQGENITNEIDNC